MGKVGSSSVYATLKNNLSQPIFHIHYINPESISKSKKEHLNSERNSLPFHLFVSEQLLQMMDKKLNIITIVREPLTRKVSSIFQNRIMFKSLISDSKGNLNYEKMEELLKKILTDSDFLRHEESWFKNEIEIPFQIDVFNTPFDLEKKYKIFKYNNCKLLVLKMEDINCTFNKAAKDLYDRTNDFKFINDNIGGNKYYSEDYQLFKQNINNFMEVSEIKETKFYNHFYNRKR